MFPPSLLLWFRNCLSKILPDLDFERAVQINIAPGIDPVREALRRQVRRAGDLQGAQLRVDAGYHVAVFYTRL